MYEVNRSLMLIKPKQAFLDWLGQLPGMNMENVTLESLQANANAILVPYVDEPSELSDFLAENMASLIATELADWCEDSDLWPEIRDAEMFFEWFDIAVHPIVSDWVEAPLERESFSPFDLD